MAPNIVVTPVTVAAGVAVLFALYYVVTKLQLYMARRKMAQANHCEPLIHAADYKDPFFASDFALEALKASKNGVILDLSFRRFQKYGTTYRARVIEQPAIFTCEPENIKTVLSLKFKDYVLANRLRLLGPLIGEGIFTADHEEWHKSRALLRPNFAREQVADIQAFERHFQEFVKSVPADGITVDLQELFFRFTIDSATEFLFGESVHALRGEGSSGNTEEAKFTWAFTYAQDQLVKKNRLGIFGSLYRGSSDLKHAIKIVHDFVDHYVDKAVKFRADLEAGLAKDDPGKYVFLYELSKAVKDKNRLRSEMLNILLAGRDTTAGLLSNMFFMIAKRPEIWSKLRREIDDTLQGKLPTYEQLRNLKYLRFCINESLRIHPVVPANARKAIHDTVLPVGGGKDGKSPILVPSGTLLVYSPYVMHRQTRFYGPDALEYRPERWEKLRTGWEYLPFNGGPRICLGQQYALTEASYVTVRLAQTFKGLESRDPGPWKEKLGFTLSSGSGCRVGLTRA